jgi:CheY-like chemotaxis protein
MQGDRQRCMDAGMDGYVAKPIKPVELFEVIDRVFAAAKASRRTLTHSQVQAILDEARRADTSKV